MLSKYFFYIGIILLIFTLVHCQAAKNNELKSSFASKIIGMPNPASVYCLKLKGKLIRKRNTYGEYDECLLSNGQRIEEWVLYRRDHPIKD